MPQADGQGRGQNSCQQNIFLSKFIKSALMKFSLLLNGLLNCLDRIFSAFIFSQLQYLICGETQLFSFDLLIIYLFAITYSFYSQSCFIFSVTDSNPLFSYRVTISSLRNNISQLADFMLNQSLMIDTHINCVLIQRGQQQLGNR